MSSKEELNQFVDKFSGAPKAQPGAGREIVVKPGRQQAIDPNRKIPELGPTATISAQTIRNRGTVAQDTQRGNNEGVRFDPPPELRAKFNAYRSSAARPRGASAAPRPQATPAGGSGGH